jgi:hypothetical protein
MSYPFGSGPFGPFLAPVVAPQGDPSGMRGLASILRIRAATVAALGRDVASAIEGVDAQGNFIKRYRADAAAWREKARGASEGLAAVAQLLDVEAGRLEQQLLDAQRAAAYGPPAPGGGL